jgi:hypothetical protein
MFGLEQGHASNGSSLENQSFLYAASETLLGGALLTPDPDPSFDAHDAKMQDSSFGEYDGLGLYEQYNDSGPSSIQFGDGTGTSVQSEIHVTSAKDEISGRTNAGFDQLLEQSSQQGQNSTEPSLTPQNPSFETHMRNSKSSVLNRSSNQSDIINRPTLSNSSTQASIMAANT